MDRHRFRDTINELDAQAARLEDLGRVPDRATAKDFHDTTKLLRKTANDLHELVKTTLPGCIHAYPVVTQGVNHDDYR